MLRTRVIPTLLMKGRGLYKGKRFRDEKYVGDPVNTATIFNDKYVDELILLDISASIENTAPKTDIIKELATSCFMPVCYGGGICSLAQMDQLFELGIEKVSLNTAVLKNPGLITEAAKRFGSQAIVVSVDVVKGFLGGYTVMEKRGTKKTKFQPIEFAQEMEARGAGEILLTSVDREGSGSGLELGLISEVSEALNIPLIAAGGIGSIAHMKEGKMAGADAFAVGRFVVFQGKHDAVLITYPDQADLKQLDEI